MFKSWIAIAAAVICGAASTAYAIDFHSEEAAKCAINHWDEIRAIADPKLSMMDSILPKAGAQRIKDLLGGQNHLPTNPPSREWLARASDAIPEPVMNMFGRDIINKCMSDGH
ncbi:hypothetical protein IW140_002926 [Coemansia sp. RSA 1813]|nr:hypothetical protein EV178_002846 [Coemansia sp. RSA 1646]KAJ1771969.1 hypothetical protein LPJ74_001861 [Coemansia sp. RSA 1843]KAJ2089742.1 hypothetical protein IW138_003198 [Coemansia sp. RSA 986]KAJ2214254.1 hypothetical protein EV179_003156 [Coemansia sp. RSA 487]KAJ2569672.1 hypothetical protein IW140_002926 [Coemansia sp. RSA 1813]